MWCVRNCTNAQDGAGAAEMQLQEEHNKELKLREKLLKEKYQQQLEDLTSIHQKALRKSQDHWEHSELELARAHREETRA